MGRRVKAFLIIVGTVFGLIVIAHIARMVVEPLTAHDPWFWLLTITAAALAGWACRLWWTLWTSKGSSR
jgi:hypothetical protein